MDINLCTFFLYSFILLIVIFMAFCYNCHSFISDYFTVRGIPYERSPWGSFFEILFHTKSFESVCSDLYKRYKSKKYVGIGLWRTPAVFLMDPQSIDGVLVQEFSHVHSRGLPHHPSELWAESLSVLSGQKWRSLRHKLTPAFSSGKVRTMFEQIMRCGERIGVSATEEDVEAENVAFKYTTQVIASCVAGIELQSDPGMWNTFKDVVYVATESSLVGRLKASLALANPKLLTFFNIHMIEKRVSEFFYDFTRSAIKCRDREKRKRSDILELMLTLKQQEEGEEEASNGKDSVELEAKCDFNINSQNDSWSENTQSKVAVFTDKCIASTLFTLVAGGIKPTASTISFALFELARNVSIQQKAQDEIDSCIAKRGGLTYEAIRDMTYLDQIIQETLRMYTSTSVLARKVTEDCHVPGTDLVLESGTFIYIPIGAIHRDPHYYPDPETFDPERFLGNNYKSSALYMPFGHGPRICIAVKFAVVIMKACVAKVLSKYYVRLSDKTQLPLRYDKTNYILKVEGGMWLTLRSRDDRYLSC